MAVDFWNVAAFIADVVAFMFTGIASEPYYVWRYMPLIGLAFAAVLIARYISIGSVLVPVQVHRTNSEILAKRDLPSRDKRSRISGPGFIVTRVPTQEYNRRDHVSSSLVFTRSNLTLLKVHRQGVQVNYLNRLCRRQWQSELAEKNCHSQKTESPNIPVKIIPIPIYWFFFSLSAKKTYAKTKVMAVYVEAMGATIETSPEDIPRT